MKQSTKQKIRVCMNITLTVFSLFALIVSMVAWFSTRKYAEIRSVELEVERQQITILKQPLSYLFPCATKIGDVTKDDFNGSCCVTGTYVIEGNMQVYADITNEDGVLGYVLDGSEGTDYFTAIASKLEQKLGTNWKKAEYNELRQALYEINISRRVGTLNKDGNIEVTIVCWTEYDKFSGKLNQMTNGVYSYIDMENLKVNVTFVA